MTCDACGHPKGWHYQNVGHCIECFCQSYKEPKDPNEKSAQWPLLTLADIEPEEGEPNGP